ncbi:hypothetical protein N7447_001691 [Penicillium robsamsonii]|uniref:uncharacterized protein n=1 Tax=Penicillium robsamsonii TaxID=1792511 RepID=UPI00254980AA|nr:uncharacterized protein N7447_001691 [Penicillium robsamsonii]KAJ5835665.1 hypothetical protein N7447_001691 [Penicillium robsamsonii]
MLLEGELYNAPVISSPQNILDLGTGTGIWVMDIAEYMKYSILYFCMPGRLTLNFGRFPNAHVIKNDISPIQPSWMAPNIESIVEHFESEWKHEQNHFDVIDARYLAGCVADWSKFMSRTHDHVKPRGYLESHERAMSARRGDEFLKETSAPMEWLQAANSAGERLESWMIEAGFEYVSLSVYNPPFSPWPRDQVVASHRFLFAALVHAGSGLRFGCG